MCLIMSIKKGIEGRQQTARELERERSLEEGREMLVNDFISLANLIFITILVFDKIAFECNK